MKGVQEGGGGNLRADYGASEGKRIAQTLLDVCATPRGVLYNFQWGVHANIWGLKFYVKLIFGVCELQHGQKFNIWGPKI